MSKISVLVNTLFVSLLIFTSCSEHEQKKNAVDHDEIDSSNFISINLNTDSIINDTTSLLFDKIYDSVRYIPLETTANSRFSVINQLEITSDFYIILDKATSSILLFTHNGKFHSKITGTRTGYFVVNKWNKQIVVCDYDSADQWCFFDFDGKLIKRERRPFSFFFFTYVSPQSIAYFKHWTTYNPDDIKLLPSKANLFNLLITNAESYIIEKRFPFDTTSLAPNEMLGVKKVFFHNRERLLYAPPYDYNIYSFDNNKITVEYKFQLAQVGSLPKDFLSNTKYYKKRQEFLNANSAIVYAISDVYQLGGYLYFKIMSNSYIESFVCNIQTKSINNIYYIASSKQSYFMPLGNEIDAADSSSVYSNISSMELLKRKFFIGKKLNSSQFPKVLNSFFLSGTSLDNPVIVQLFPKNKFIKKN